MLLVCATSHATHQRVLVFALDDISALVFVEVVLNRPAQDNRTTNARAKVAFACNLANLAILYKFAYLYEMILADALLVQTAMNTERNGPCVGLLR